MKRKTLLSIFFLLPFLNFAQTDSFVFTPKMTVEQYVEKYNSLAVDEMYRSKIPASITLAQGILESANGNSRLAIEGNNHFGIKCKSTWTGKTIFEDDDAPQECFRKYDAAIDSYHDHSDFLMNNPRYAFLFDLGQTDYKSWAKGLKNAGYATNPQYPELLITFIERHNLNRFDRVVLSEEEDRMFKEEKAEIVKSYGKEFENNGVPGIVAKENESFAQIALDYDLSVNQLYRYNDLSKDAICHGGDTVYLKAKKNNTDSLYHLVQKGQTMRWISQRYAIKLDKLLERNRMTAGQEPSRDERIYLQSKRPNMPSLLIPNPTVCKAGPLKDTIVVKADTLYNLKVYDNPLKNLETSKPVEITEVKDSLHNFKENLSFFHTVQKGETLYGIGKKYGVRVDAIQYLNALNTDSIEIGQRLIINPAITSADTKEPQTIPGVHVVRQGETLYSIAKQYGLGTGDLIATNNLKNETIVLGQHLLVVPTLNNKETFDKDSEEQVKYTVSKGETIYSVSRKFGITIEQLRQVNNLQNDSLNDGQKIRIR